MNVNREPLTHSGTRDMLGLGGEILLGRTYWSLEIKRRFWGGQSKHADNIDVTRRNIDVT